MSEEYVGILETMERRSYGFLRSYATSLKRTNRDPYVSGNLIDRHNLRDGVKLNCRVEKESRNNYKVTRVSGVNDYKPSDWAAFRDFRSWTVIQPKEQIVLETEPENYSMRILDLLCPIGKGQRGLIVSPPKAGKTMLLQKIANSVHQNNPEIEVIVLLIDERPEEVTDMTRSIKGEVYASSNDEEHSNHVRIGQLGLEIAKRRVETGKDVLVLLDSITRLGRAFNLDSPSTGRTMTGGIDARALEIPRRIFGAARNLEGGGSLTVIGTALVETNSRMDDFIYEEFRGTGNMEVHLDRDLANKFIFPAIDVVRSGTRKTELLLGDDVKKIHTLRRYLMKLNSKEEAIEAMLEGLSKTQTNRELLESLKEPAYR